jgi:hypothetical protein
MGIDMWLAVHISIKLSTSVAQSMVGSCWLLLVFNENVELRGYAFFMENEYSAYEHL